MATGSIQFRSEFGFAPLLVLVRLLPAMQIAYGEGKAILTRERSFGGSEGSISLLPSAKLMCAGYIVGYKSYGA
jgi:hypothetical protein